MQMLVHVQAFMYNKGMGEEENERIEETILL